MTWSRAARISLLLALGCLGLMALALVYILSQPLPALDAPSIAPEAAFATTEDGWALALHHYPPCWRGPCTEGFERREDAAPVLLCHGLSSSRFTFDLGEDRSLARYLADRGFDIWMVELRGHGASRRAEGAGPYDEGEISLDAHIALDVPTIIAAVKTRAQSDEVHWVGHSMGGMIAFGYLSQHPDADIASAVAISSPGRFFPDTDPLLGMMMGHLDIAEAFPAMPATMGGEVLSRVTGRPPFTGFSWELENIEEDAVKRYLAYGLSPVYPGQLKSMRVTLAAGGLTSVDGRMAYFERYGDITTPFLFMTGTEDKLAPPRGIRAVFDAVGSADKALVIAGEETGFSTDYGHGDILLGDEAQREIYPIVLDWLERHAAPPPPPAPEFTPSPLP